MTIIKDSTHYVDQHYDFNGLWDSPSRCGLKVIQRKDGKTVVIVTELYTDNPGTSVTQWITPLANELMHKFMVPFENFIFIERTPDTGSRLTFLVETFDRLDFSWDGEKLYEPKWQRLTREQVDELMQG